VLEYALSKAYQALFTFLTVKLGIKHNNYIKMVFLMTILLENAKMKAVKD